jgi:cytochrome c oxidase assembly protein subunit 15
VVLLNDAIGIFHAALAQIFWVLVCCLALFSSAWWHRFRQGSVPGCSTNRLRIALSGITLLIFAQLIVGATMRHQHAGLAVPDFPLAYGQWWPPTDPASLEQINRNRTDVLDYGLITAFQIGLHMAHRIGALLILLGAIFLVWLTSTLKHYPSLIIRGGRVLFGMLCVQALLGAATVWSNKAADMATAHVVLGAASLAWAGLLCTVAWLLPLPSSASLSRAHTTHKENATPHSAGAVLGIT